MSKIFNFLILILIAIFFFNIFNYYSSSINQNYKKFNRLNIDQILENKISNLPVLENDTNNVIDFNNDLENEIKNKKKRNYWDLLKIK